tara:strand:- start:119 stop:397 length:279 start_codon:yes stop_codon:yes gene_type:complete
MTTTSKKLGSASTSTRRPQLDPKPQSRFSKDYIKILPKNDFYKDGKLQIVIIGKDGKPKVVGQEQKFKSGGRAGFKVGGAAKRGISKILRKK